MAIREEEMQTSGGERAARLPEIEIRPLKTGEDATAFRTLNEEWITRYFTLEKMDRETLGDPENKILRKGGHIFMAYVGHQAVGCVALIPSATVSMSYRRWRCRQSYVVWGLAAGCCSMRSRRRS